VVKHAQPRRSQNLSALRVQANREIYLLHPIRHRQRHVPSVVEKRFPAVNTGSPGKVCGPLGAFLVKTDRLTRVIKSRADQRSLWELLEDLQRAREVV